MSTISNATVAGLAARIRRAASQPGSEPIDDLVDRELSLNAEAHLISGQADTSEQRLRQQLHTELRGAGPHQQYLDDAEVKEIWVNAPDRVFIARSGVSERVEVVLDAEMVRDLAEKMLRATG